MTSTARPHPATDAAAAKGGQIEVRGLKKNYGAHAVFDGVNLEIDVIAVVLA